MYKTLILLYLRIIKRLNAPARIIDFSIKKYARNPFIIQPDRNFHLSFKEFGERLEKLAFFFNAKDVFYAETIAFSAKNSFEYFEIRAACHKLGIVFLGLPPNLSADDIVYFLNKTKARIFFYKQGELVDLNLIKKEAQLKCCIDLDSSEYKEIFQRIKANKRLLHPCGVRNDTQLGRNDTQLTVQGRNDTIATFNLSSGTTEKTPKIISLTNKNWIESLYGIIRNANIQPNKKVVFLCAVSFLTSGSTTFLPALIAGATNIVVNKDISPQELAEIIKQYNVTRLYITPSRLLELLEYCEKNNLRLSSLENITIGTERICALKLKEAIDFFGAIIHAGYGMVEALPPIAMLGPRDYCRARSPNAPYEANGVKIGPFGERSLHNYVSSNLTVFDSVGKVSKGVKVKILEGGRIAIKSKTVSAGYLDNPDETVCCFKDGWFYSNDYGHIDKKGFLFILGRKEEILVEQPRRIFAKEIEDKVYVLPYVKSCACAAKNGKIVVFVSLRGKVDEQGVKEEILRLASGEAQDDNLPQDDIQIVIKESLPLNYAGKLDRKALQQMEDERQ